MTIVIAHCGAAGPPAPPVETPSPVVLKFVEPDALKIDLTAVSASATPDISKFVDPAGEFADEIVYGYASTEGFYDNVLGAGLAGISKMEIPVDVATTTFEATVDFGRRLGFTGDVLEGVHDVKIDFADFDWDNDGANEGCSGHTDGLPICARIWVEQDGVFERYAAWILESYPDDTLGPGSGRFKIYFTVMPENVRNLIRVDYDFDDPLAVFTEFSNQGLFGDDTGLAGHGLISSTGDPATALKRIDYSITADTDGPGGPTLWEFEFNYLAQFREGYDFWSGSIVDGAQYSLTDLDNQCARISTADGVAEGECADVGGLDIRVGTVASDPFIAPMDPADVAIPDDFPELPTF